MTKPNLKLNYHMPEILEGIFFNAGIRYEYTNTQTWLYFERVSQFYLILSFLKAVETVNYSVDTCSRFEQLEPTEKLENAA